MKFKVQSSKFADGWRKRADSARVLRTSNFDLRSSRLRRASVLVLVMTLLGILFVLGVAFLASMNFEADMIVSETQRNRADSRVTAVVDQLGSTLRDGLMSESRVPFGNPSTAMSATAYAEMPGVHNSFSPIEPHWEPDPGPDGIQGNADDREDKLVFSPYADVAALKRHPFTGPSLPHGFAIDTSFPNGDMIAMLPDGRNLKKCLGGGNKGNACESDVECPGSTCEGPRVLDADGDGIADSLQVDAKTLDFSEAQLAALSARLNPASNPTGKVFVGMRIIPHGGLVNLNASHPKLIENVLDVPNEIDNARMGLRPDPEYNFYHRPTRNQVAYSPLLEEPTLRRRVFLPPRTMPPSWLHGDPFSLVPNAGADMPWQLFAPLPINAAAKARCDPDPYSAEFDRCYRYRSIVPNEVFNPLDPDSPRLWAVRMEPFSSANADSTMREYDRRHLVTTISHDDLLARGGRVPNPSAPGGEEDILTKMTQANQTEYLLDDCERHLQFGDVDFVFEYPEYPRTVLDNCCPTEVGCKLNARKGRLQLSLPYLDDQIDEANKITDPDPKKEALLRQEALDRVVHLIHDAFFLLVRNAAHLTTLEGTPCDPRVFPNPDCVYANGFCGKNGKCTLAAVPPIIFADCRPPPPVGRPCSIPGSVCRTTDGVCTIQAPYWQDVPCAATPTACNSAAGETCNMALDRCVDAWTGQTHSQALISRTAAALTANLIDFADADDVPTRIALRSLDLTTGQCIAPPASVGRACDMDADCGSGGTCSPPRGMCARGANTGRVCGSNAYCGLSNGLCLPPAKAAGREFGFNRCVGGTNDSRLCNSDADCPNGTCRALPTYVYGLERQPYITEVATSTDAAGLVVAWAVELFNPHTSEINLTTGGYYLHQVPLLPADPVPPPISLDVTLGANFGTNPMPLTAFVFDPTNVGLNAMLGNTPVGTVIQLPVGRTFEFRKGWTLYLVRQFTYPGDLSATNIVVDQFVVNGNDTGVNLPPGAGGVYPAIFTIERFVQPPPPANPSSFWTATIPINATAPSIGESPIATLGDWNGFIPVVPPHPVEVNFANLGSFTRPFRNLTDVNDPRNGSVSFPTTGSLLMLMRHANRAFPDYTPPPQCIGGTNAGRACNADADCPGGVCPDPVTDLAFTTRLVGVTNTVDSRGAPVAIQESEQIDNGRMPVFDLGAVSPNDQRYYAAHHLAPFVTRLEAPGNLDTLPWGQLVFDYFTALPLSNLGPYVDSDPGPDVVVAMPDSQPRVDLDGLRVHGRININAAPWKVLAGLPFIPMEKIPLAFKAKMRRTLGLVVKNAPEPPTTDDFIVKDADAGTIGEALAQAVVAYRELRPLGGSGDYADGTPRAGPAPGIAYARGWNPTLPGPPPAPVPLMARRGTGFMTVGELANVRHLGIADPLYRIDSGVIDVDQAENNTENFVDAAATLVALGDWVTVRSQVFTVYGVLRGEEDSTIVDPDPGTPPTQAELRVRDADSRALRFQETIDRLPTFLGDPVPSRIGGRTLSRYTDVRND